MIQPEIKLVRSTYRFLRPQHTQLAELFFARLFQLDPELHHIFGSDLATHQSRLPTLVRLWLNSLPDLYRLKPLAYQLSRLFALYGLRESQLYLIRSALLWTLAHGLGTHFTASVREAWADAFALLANLIRESTRRFEIAYSH